MAASVGQSVVSEGVPRPKVSCRSLKGMTVPATAIGLPTTGAYVRSAKLVHDNRGEYCKVIGGVRVCVATSVRFRKWNAISEK